MLKKVWIFLLVLGICSPSLTWADSHSAVSCTSADVNAAIAVASAGDTVTVPAGSCTWSTTARVTINKSLHLQGAGIGVTNISVGSGSGYSPVVAITAGDVKISGFTFKHLASNNSYTISIGAPGFRVTGNKFTTNDDSYYANTYVINISGSSGEGNYGLIDDNQFLRLSGETIFARGPCNSWQTDNSLGGANNIFIENNIFTSNGNGYVTDCNADSRCVVRYNDIDGMKIDMHGKCSNTNPSCTPATHRSVRHYEIYNNVLTTLAGRAMEIRGGTGRIFNNTIIGTVGRPLIVEDYATFQTGCYGYTPSCGCPNLYPLDDQIGVGKDPKIAASEPLYLWGNKQNKNGISMDWGAVMPTWELSSTKCKADTICTSNYTSLTQIQLNRDYYESSTKPDAMKDYRPYTCPHPLAGMGSCNETVAGRSGYIAGQNKPATPQNFRLQP